MIQQWFVLYRKEMLEMMRNYKWVWVPLVFILFGASQPITTYYMSDILSASGGLPEGTIIQIPMPTGAEMMAQTLSQFSTIGVLVLVLAFMGAVSAERLSGAIYMVLMKPVPHHTYVTAKWAAMATLTGVSLLTGMMAAWYYTELLIGDVTAAALLQSFLLYGLWLAFILTVTLLLSILLKSSGSIAFLSVGIIFLLSIMTSILTRWMKWSPAALTEHATEVLIHGSAGSQLALCLSATVLLIGILLVLSVYSLRLKQTSL
ncbi:MAG: transporter permease [Paenibacillus sp.]|nr:transporter permease [Paenibacillus sp.]